MAETRQYCTFFLDDLYLGVEVERVQEVIRYQEMTRVPLAAAGVQGLINLRGQIVTAIDLRRRLDLGERSTELPPMNVVVRADDGIVSLLVDEIGDVLEVCESAYERPPATLKAEARALIRGAYKLDERLLLDLDTDAALHLEGKAKTTLRAPMPGLSFGHAATDVADDHGAAASGRRPAPTTANSATTESQAAGEASPEPAAGDSAANSNWEARRAASEQAAAMLIAARLRARETSVEVLSS